jgi:hypothetical protein
MLKFPLQSVVLVRALAVLFVVAFATAATAQTVQLTSPSTAAGAELGYALSVEGTRIAVGIPGDAGQAGAVQVYSCSAGVCTAAVRISAPDTAAGDLFGSAVALSGTSLAIAAPGQSPGAVYVFVLVGPDWVPQAKIVAAGGDASAGFGAALALEADRLMVGADRADNRAGATYVYARSGVAWTQDARLTAADAASGDRFGSSVALSADSVLIGAPLHAAATVGSFGQGAAYVFVRSLGSWSQQARLLAVAGSNADGFGTAVSLDGNRALIGAPVAGGAGHAYIFERAGAVWSEQALLGAIDGLPGDRFGWSVALSNDVAVIGAPFALASCGNSVVFRRNGASWVETAGATIVTPNFGNLAGWSVATDGSRFVVGAPGYAGAPDHRGAAFWFDPIEQVFADGLDGNAAVACVPAA